MHLIFSLVCLLFFTDVYGSKIDELSVKTKYNLKKLKKLIFQEYELTLKLATLQGALQMVLAASNTNYDVQKPKETMEPTVAARENFVVNVS